MNDEKELTEQESLRLITQMINQAKDFYYESGLNALMWGFTNLICFTLAYFDAVMKNFNLPFSPFFLMAITFVVQLYYDRKEALQRKAMAATYLDDVHKYIWMSFGFAVLIFTIVAGIANVGYNTLPVLLLLFGMPTLISGCISKCSSMIIGAIICWVFSIIAFLHQGYYAYLLCAAGATAAWIIPGFILRSKFNEQLKIAEQKEQHGV
jgi:hypothetical protein